VKPVVKKSTNHQGSMKTRSIIFALENVFLNTEQSIQMSIKNNIKITVLKTINTVYELSRVVAVCFIKKELL
jgi:hypothetical protein